jgi:ABC-2 type transport system permease protein
MNSESEITGLTEPGIPTIKRINWRGLQALYMKEVRRFFKVHTQTIWAPALTTLLYLIIFTVSIGGPGRKSLGVPFADFLAPGLIMMGMIQNAFANSSFALLVGKIQGTIIDYLLPPLSSAELLIGITAASVTRAILVGLTIWGAMLLWPGVHVTPRHIWAILLFGLLGSTMLALIGVLTSIWAEKFDHAAAIGNFVVAPLALLSGTFYSTDKLSPTFAMISQANPFHHAISGFRYGFIGQADMSLFSGAAVLISINIALGTTCYLLLRSGWKIKS